MADAIHELKAKMGLRNDLKDLHLTEEQISELVRISRHPTFTTIRLKLLMKC